jgi:hypothetical protein
MSYILRDIYSYMRLHTNPRISRPAPRSCAGRHIYVHSVLCLRIVADIFLHEPRTSAIGLVHDHGSGDVTEWLCSHYGRGRQ